LRSRIKGWFSAKPNAVASCLPDLPPDQLAHPEFVYSNGPRVHQYLQDLHHEILMSYNAMSVGEAFGVTMEQATLFTDARRGELSMIFQFDVVRLDRQNWCKTDWTLPALKAAYARIDQAAGLHGWATSYLCNHDNPRAVSHFGDAA
jgi:oligo-1,6-glucosidase